MRLSAEDREMLDGSFLRIKLQSIAERKPGSAFKKKLEKIAKLKPKGEAKDTK